MDFGVFIRKKLEKMRVRLTNEAIFRIRNPKNQHIKNGLGDPMWYESKRNITMNLVMVK